jgi:RimJ/RimL family protein N-acetyltransferase
VIRGEKVALGSFQAELVDTVLRWLEEFGHTQPPRAGGPGPHDCLFFIHELSSMRAVGSCGLHDVDPLAGTAEFGILIGERDAWNRGYGTEATKLTLSHAFETLRLRSVHLRVDDSNVAAKKAYERAGFIAVGQPQSRVVRMECIRPRR